MPARTDMPDLPSRPQRLRQFLWSSPVLLMVITLLCWSGNFVLGRAVHADVPPVGLSFWRWTLAFLLVLGFAWPHLRRDAQALWSRKWLILALAFLGVASFNTLVYHALSTTTATNAVLMQAVMPMMILLASWLLFREPMGWRALAAFGLSLAGVAVIVSGGQWQRLIHLSLTPGDGWVLLAVTFYAFYSALLRLRPDVHPLSLLAATFMVGTLILLPLYLWEHFTVRAVQINGVTLTTLAYVAIFPSLLAYLCFNRAVALMGANKAGQFINLMPVFGTALAVVFLGERLQAAHLLGAAFIATGLWLIYRPGSRRTPAP
jgi:drug/metabolite transporter (DMT)-like permease